MKFSMFFKTYRALVHRTEFCSVLIAFHLVKKTQKLARFKLKDDKFVKRMSWVCCRKSPEHYIVVLLR